MKAPILAAVLAIALTGGAMAQSDSPGVSPGNGDDRATTSSAPQSTSETETPINNLRTMMFNRDGIDCYDASVTTASNRNSDNPPSDNSTAAASGPTNEGCR